MKQLILILAISSLTVSNAQKLIKNWEVSGLEAPESVVKVKDTYLVTNVAGQPAEKNGLGYITQLNENGEIKFKKWATGFNAPKGLGIYEEELYVADIDVVVIVDLKTGKITNRLPVPGATFLNDIEVAKDGTIYVSDTFGGNSIYKIEEKKISLWIKDESLDYPNGLKIKGEELLVSSWGVVTNPETFETEVPGMLLSVNLKDKSIKKLTKSFGNLDGLVLFGNEFLVSDWISGKILTIDKDYSIKAILELKPGAADILLLDNQKELLVPQMIEGLLTSYSIE